MSDRTAKDDIPRSFLDIFAFAFIPGAVTVAVTVDANELELFKLKLTPKVLPEFSKDVEPAFSAVEGTDSREAMADDSYYFFCRNYIQSSNCGNINSKIEDIRCVVMRRAHRRACLEEVSP